VTVDYEPNLGELFALLVHGAVWTQMSNFAEPKHVMDTVRRDPGYYRRLPTAVREAIGPFLRNQAAALPYDVVRDVVGLLLIQLSPVYCPDVALAIACHPWLLVDLPDLAFTGTWLGPESPPAWVRVVLRAAQARASGEAAKRLADLLRELPPPASALEPDNHVAAVLIRLFRAATSQSTHS